MRIAGILCGSALAIGFLIVVLGMPEILPAADEPQEAQASPAPLLEIETAIEDDPAVAPDPEPVSDVAPLPDDLPVTEELPVLSPMEQAVPENWFAFWSPFRSEIAASGFISRLQRETGIDYRVVKVKPGVYEVAFAYDGDADIDAKLATITRATGLEMPDG